MVFLNVCGMTSIDEVVSRLEGKRRGKGREAVRIDGGGGEKTGGKTHGNEEHVQKEENADVASQG